MLGKNCEFGTRAPSAAARYRPSGRSEHSSEPTSPIVSLGVTAPASTDDRRLEPQDLPSIPTSAFTMDAGAHAWLSDPAFPSATNQIYSQPQTGAFGQSMSGDVDLDSLLTGLHWLDTQPFATRADEEPAQKFLGQQPYQTEDAFDFWKLFPELHVEGATLAPSSSSAPFHHEVGPVVQSAGSVSHTSETSRARRMPQLQDGLRTRAATPDHPRDAQQKRWPLTWYPDTDERPLPMADFELDESKSGL